MVIGPAAFRPEVVLGQIEQFTPDLDRRQVEEVSHGLHLDFCHRPVKPDHRILKYVVRLLPAAQVGVAVEHLSSESEQPVAGVIEQSVMRSSIPV